MGYVSTGIGDRIGALLVSLMALRLVLRDQNPFWSCVSSCYLLFSDHIEFIGNVEIFEQNIAFNAIHIYHFKMANFHLHSVHK